MVPKTLHMLIVAVLLLVTSLGMYGAFWYAVSARETAFRVRAEEQVSAQARIAEASRLATLVSDTEAARTALKAFLVADDGVVSFLSLVERSGRGAGLSVSTKSVTIEKGDANSPFDALVLTIEIEGAYTNVMHMVQMIESMPYQVTVRSVALDRTQRGGLGSVWHGIFTLSVTKAKAS